MSVMEADDWTLAARCRGMEDALFPEGKDQKRVRSVCTRCPVRVRCLVEALDNRIEWGIWGGMTERERRQVLRQNPDVSSWARLLDREGAVSDLLLGTNRRTVRADDNGPSSQG